MPSHTLSASPSAPPGSRCRHCGSYRGCGPHMGRWSAELPNILELRPLMCPQARRVWQVPYVPLCPSCVEAPQCGFPLRPVVAQAATPSETARASMVFSVAPRHAALQRCCAHLALHFAAALSRAGSNPNPRVRLWPAYASTPTEPCGCTGILPLTPSGNQRNGMLRQAGSGHGLGSCDPHGMPRVEE